MTTLGVIRYSGTLTVPAQPEPGAYCPTCRRLGLLLTPPLHNVWGHYCSGCQQLFNGLATYPGRLRADARGSYDVLRTLRDALRKLTDAVTTHLAALDQTMQEPSTEARGKEIARLATALNYAYDMAMHFSLGLSFPAIERRKQAVRRRPRRKRATPAAAGDEEAAA